MRHIIRVVRIRIALIGFLSMFIFYAGAQETEDRSMLNSSKHALGISVQYDPNFGIMLGGDYFYSLSERWTTYAGIASNLIGSYSIRAGATYAILDYDFLRLHGGIGLNAIRSNLHNYFDNPEAKLPWLWELEIPMQLEIPLSERWSLTSGMSLRLPINEVKSINGGGIPYEGFWGRLRIGTKYRF